MSLVTRGYLAPPTLMAWPVDPDIRVGLASEWCKVVRVTQFTITTSKNVRQREPNAAVAVDEEYGQQKYSAFDMSSDIHFVGRGPTLLRHHGTPG